MNLILCRHLILRAARVPPANGFSTTNAVRLASKFKARRLEKDLELAKTIGLKRSKNYIRTHLTNLMKMDPKLEAILVPLRSEVKAQGDIVRSLKEGAAPQADIDAAVRQLIEKKRVLDAKEASLVPTSKFVDRGRLDDVLKRRFFFDLSFSIYGGVSGLYDYGPPGIALKRNILKLWEAHFILEDDLLEIEASQITLEPVLKASGHVDKFADLMIRDVKTGDCYRLDHLIKNHLEKLASAKNCTEAEKKLLEDTLCQLDNFSQEQLHDIVKKYSMKAPATGNDLGEPVEFNLMFSTSIGPAGLIKSYLRPETAQGIFVNFKRLIEANGGKLPFGVAQIGKSFRNEISPRGGLVRMREFTMAEIEYFVDPEHKSHPKYDSIKNTRLNLYSACNQMNGESYQTISLEEAVNSGTVANETLAYFLARIDLFMTKIGIDPAKIRFRQHMQNEMAHYATDCWDCECLTTSGWLECIGCADRSCYDLKQHAKATHNKLSANRPLDAPKDIEIVSCVVQKPVLGKQFKGEAKAIIDTLQNADEEQLLQWEEELKSGLLKLSIEDKEYELSPEFVGFKREKKTVRVEEVVPNVIEPSFGIDRILHSLLEHSFKIREDNQLRTYFSFPAIIAPIKCSVLPLDGNQAFRPIVEEILSNLKREGVRPKVDSSGESIGRRYARTDELGIPYGITVDYDTTKDKTVTLRYCETLEQIRVGVDVVASLVRDLTNGTLEWERAKKLYPEFIAQKET